MISYSQVISTTVIASERQFLNDKSTKTDNAHYNLARHINISTALGTVLKGNTSPI